MLTEKYISAETKDTLMQQEEGFELKVEDTSTDLESPMRHFRGIHKLKVNTKYNVSSSNKTFGNYTIHQEKSPCFRNSSDESHSLGSSNAGSPCKIEDSIESQQKKYLKKILIEGLLFRDRLALSQTPWIIGHVL